MKKHLINSLKFVWTNMAKIFYMLLLLLWVIFPDDFYKIHTNDMIMYSLVIVVGIIQEYNEKLFKKIDS